MLMDEHAMQSRLPSAEERNGKSGSIMQPFEIIMDNVYMLDDNDNDDDSDSAAEWSNGLVMEQVFPCECRYSPEMPLSQTACGENSSCINRSLFVECNPDDCPSGREHCQNQRFQSRNYAPVTVRATPGKGFGLFADQDIPANTFIMEYVGDVVSSETFAERREEYAESEQKHYYFMTLHQDLVIDATQRGNLARFMNHSCNPNCATQKWIVNGHMRIGLFSLRNISAGAELTFDYKFVRFGSEAQRCLCGEPNCKQWIGQEAKTLAIVDHEEEDAEEVEEDEDEDGLYDRLAASDYVLGMVDSSVKKRQQEQQLREDVTDITKLLLRIEKIGEILPLLSTLLRSDSQAHSLFLNLHGLQIITMLLGSLCTAHVFDSPSERTNATEISEENSVKKSSIDRHTDQKMVIGNLLDLLLLLPLKDQSVLQDNSKLYERVALVLERSRDKDPLVMQKTSKVLDRLDKLPPKPFRIPRRQQNLAVDTSTHSSSKSTGVSDQSKVTFSGYSLGQVVDNRPSALGTVRSGTSSSWMSSRPMTVNTHHASSSYQQQTPNAVVGVGYNPNFAGVGYNPNFAGVGHDPNFAAVRHDPNFAGVGYNPNFGEQHQSRPSNNTMSWPEPLDERRDQRRAHDERRDYDRRAGDRSYGDRSYSERSHDRSYSERPHDRSYTERSHGQRSHDEKSHGQRSYGERSHDSRSFNERSYNERSHGRSYSHGSQSDRTHGSRFHQDRSY